MLTLLIVRALLVLALSLTLALISARGFAPSLPYGGALVLAGRTSGGLFLLDAARQTAVPLLRPGAVQTLNPRWSANGRQLIVSVHNTRTRVFSDHYLLFDFSLRRVEARTPDDVQGKITDGSLHLAYFSESGGALWTMMQNPAMTISPRVRLDTFMPIGAGFESIRIAVIERIDAASYQLKVSDIGSDGSSITHRSWVYPRTWSSFPVFSPDAENLLVWQGNESDSQYHLYRFNLNNGDAALIGMTPVWSGGAVAWSPDNMLVAYTYVPAGSVRHPQIRVIMEDEQTLTLYQAGEGETITALAWSPDGTRIAFTINWRGSGSALCFLVLDEEAVRCWQGSSAGDQFAWQPR